MGTTDRYNIIIIYYNTVRLSFFFPVDDSVKNKFQTLHNKRRLVYEIGTQAARE